MVDQKLMEYIKNNIKKSGPGGVRKALVNSGWDVAKVDQALNEFQPPPEKAPSKPAPKKVLSSKAIAVISIVAVVAVIAVYFLFSGPPESGPPVLPPDDNQTGPISVGVSPVTATAGVGDSISISVVASQTENLFGFQFNIEYNSSILSFVDISEGTFLNNNGADNTFCVTPKTETSGLIKNYACTRTQKGEVSGTGTLAIVTFDVLSAGTSTVTLSNVKFADSRAEQIDSTVSSGQVIAE